MVSLDRSNGSWNSLDDLSRKLCVPNKTEDVFILITKTIGSKTLQKHISYDCKCIFDGRKVNSNQKWNKDRWCKHPIKNRLCINDYV